MRTNMKNKFATYIIVTGFVIFAAGCGPSIAIRHQDATHEEVTVKIDGIEKDRLLYGDENKFSVSKGLHKVEITPKGSKECPWTADGNGWDIWVDVSTSLVLLPPAEQ